MRWQHGELNDDGAFHRVGLARARSRGSRRRSGQLLSVGGPGVRRCRFGERAASQSGTGSHCRHHFGDAQDAHYALHVIGLDVQAILRYP